MKEEASSGKVSCINLTIQAYAKLDSKTPAEEFYEIDFSWKTSSGHSVAGKGELGEGGFFIFIGEEKSSGFYPEIMRIVDSLSLGIPPDPGA
jgi:hypothetical protein